MTPNINWNRRLAVGAIAGVVGGVASSIVFWTIMEPLIGQAIALEDDHDHTHGSTNAEIVTRLQQQVGGTLTVIVIGVLMGIVFAVVYARTSHRFSGSTDLGKSLHLACLVFVVHALIPAIMIPANPPGVGEPDTIDYRTLWYLAAVLLGTLFCGASFALSRMMERRGADPWLRWSGIAVFIVFGLVMVYGGPRISDNIPPSMPASLLWEFRIGSLTQLAAMWAAIGTVHGIAHRRFHTRVVATTAVFVPSSAQDGHAR